MTGTERKTEPRKRECGREGPEPGAEAGTPASPAELRFSRASKRLQKEDIGLGRTDGEQAPPTCVRRFVVCPMRL